MEFKFKEIKNNIKCGDIVKGTDALYMIRIDDSEEIKVVNYLEKEK